MLPDLEHLIQLQRLENAATDSKERIAALPTRLGALDDRLTVAQTAVDVASARLADHRTSRAVIEKNVAEVQTRLSRYKEQLMAVKTNKEYHAMQAEIAGAERQVRDLEDSLLERMLEADDLAREVSEATQRLAEEQRAVEEERAAIEADRQELEQRLSAIEADRAAVSAEMSPAVRELFATLARGRKGIAVAEANQGRCTSCQVRLRPQLFNQVRANAALIQCESCQRILYYAEHRHATSDA